MSSQALPITSARFAEALTELPLSSLYAKRSEIMNSIFHLEKSNIDLQSFADEGDEICKEALDENKEVMEKLGTRLDLLKIEVESRGYRWDDGLTLSNGEKSTVAALQDTHTSNVTEHINTGDTSQTQEQQPATSETRSTGQGGRLSDEELARRIAEQMADDNGLHL